MFRTLITEFVFPLLLFLLVRSMLKGMFSSSSSSSNAPQRSERPTVEVPTGGELKKDPVCGTYVSTSGSLSRRVGGEMVYFCSAECREKFKS
jgi:YHS domain-containing protein